MSRNAKSESRFPTNFSIGKTRWELPYEGMTEQLWDEHKALLHAKQPFRDFLLKRRDKNGRLHYISISGAPVLDANGNLKGYRGIGRDVTEQKLAEKRMKMESAVTRLLSKGDEVDTTFPKILQAICEALDCDYGAYAGHDSRQDSFLQSYIWHLPSLDDTDLLEEFHRSPRFRPNIGNQEVGGIRRRAWHTRKPLWIENVLEDPSFRRRESAAKAGLHTAFAFPVLIDGAAFGVAEFYSREHQQQDPFLLQSLESVGNQIGLFLQRKQLEAHQVMQNIVPRLLHESDTAAQAMPRILQTICETLRWDYGGYWIVEKQTGLLHCRGTWTNGRTDVKEFVDGNLQKVFQIEKIKPRPHQGILRRVFETKKPIWAADLSQQENSKRSMRAVKADLHSMFAFPILTGKEIIGAVEFFSHHIRQPDEILMETASAIGIQMRIGRDYGFFRQNDLNHLIWK
jgi:transcriptional regulator with GAF, ATPase, and Fis domain